MFRFLHKNLEDEDLDIIEALTNEIKRIEWWLSGIRKVLEEFKEGKIAPEELVEKNENIKKDLAWMAEALKKGILDIGYLYNDEKLREKLEVVRCPKCKRYIFRGARHCNKCGAKIPTPEIGARGIQTTKCPNPKCGKDATLFFRAGKSMIRCDHCGYKSYMTRE